MWRTTVGGDYCVSVQRTVLRYLTPSTSTIKEIHKYMWKCPGRGIQSIIDYDLVRDEMKTKVNDVKVVTKLGSDHHLVVMKVRLHRRVYAS